MEPAGQLSLPFELIHHISSFLSVEDVLSCSLTCHYLRSALNENTVWKRYLPEQDLTRLESLEQHVQPTFQLEQTLTPLCDNRIHFMRKARLLNNWKEGNFVEFSTNTDSVYAHGVLNVSKAQGELVYRDKYLFLSRYQNDVESDSIEVWDVENTPTLFTKVKMDNVNYKCFYLIGDYLVIVECIRVNVYSINVEDKSIPLAFSFVIPEEDISKFQEISHPGIHDYRCVGWSHSTAGQYLASSKCEEGVLHVWDIVNACKVGSFTPPVYGFSIRIFSQVGNDWLLFQNSQSSDDYFLFRFNIENREFSDRFFHYNGRWMHMINYECYVILFKLAFEYSSDSSDTICELYDFNTSEKLKTRRFDDRQRNSRIKRTKVFNGTFVMLCSDGFHIIDARTLDTVDRFQCDGDDGFISRHWNIHGSVFVGVTKKNYVSEIWDVRNKKKLPKCLKHVHNDHLYFNDLYTVSASFEWMKINVVHFW
ncbi:uncharacterized protein LOC124359936 isoform X4 [Homalodisca vitripennis]|uniref:uncharacterized protein LOC124359936 isoform X4 n=1 Tax=Homalodisca vitripennis TaxID=197043 RepID=UPI001EEA4A4C|nr:uncharacterized protein LOC124359936 isoform X4 [Homalodisca vitripennis]KAG8280306.1 hypothetical protein J6590_084845 [Homalodisca vitripennis]